MKQAIIITGAAGGLGKAIVDTCLSAFPELLIVATDISPDIGSMPDNDHILEMKVDVTDEDSIIALRKALEEMGVHTWAIVNNAGVSDFFPVSEKEKDALEKMFAIGPVSEILQLLNWQGPVYTISAISKIGTEDLAFDIMKQLESDQEYERDNEPSSDQAFDPIIEPQQENE